MENEALDDIVAKQLQSCSSMRERMLAGALRSQGLWLQRQRLCESIMRVDPLGRILRRFQKVMRRPVHKIEGPNALYCGAKETNCNCHNFIKYFIFHFRKRNVKDEFLPPTAQHFLGDADKLCNPVPCKS